MRHNRVFLISLISLVVLLFLPLQGCRKERPSFERNFPPETFLTSVPFDSSQVFYRVRLYWGGLDPDGQVMGYYYAMRDSNLTPEESTWTWTTATEMEFSLTANNPEMLGHRFFCKAVDDRGLEDPTPAFVFFYARDYNLPKVRFTKAFAVTPQGQSQPLTAATLAQLTDAVAGDTMPTNSSVSFAWQGWDEDPGGYITGYLYRMSNDAEYREGSVADTTFSTVIPRAGTYTFEVLGVDDAGAKSRRDTLRYFQVNYDPDTWIVPPCEGCPKGFLEGGSIARVEGDTLRQVTNLKVSFQWDGWDKDGYLVGWTRRLTREGGGPAYQYVNLGNRTWETASLESGNYEFFVRGRDNEIKDDGTPASVKFNVNCAPFFEGESRCCTCPDGQLVTCEQPCTLTLVVLDGLVYDSLFCAACDIESGTAAEYRTTLNGNIGSWRASPVDILVKENGLKTGWNTAIIQARDKQPDGTIGRTVSTTREFYVDVPIP